MNLCTALLWVCAAIIYEVHGAPSRQKIETDPELTAGYFQGDMVLDVPKSLKEVDPIFMNGLKNTSRRWPNNTVYYKFNRGFFDAEHRNHIERGMQIIEELSCIRFKEVTGFEENYYVNITGFPKGCYSSVGWLNKIQTYNLAIYPLDTGCFRMGTIVHELLHTLGFHHMQSAWDRDDYVRIVKENIISGKENNFNKYENDTVDHYDQEYDYGSIMHYSAKAFSANGEPTIVALREEGTEPGIMGQRRILTKSDVRKLNVMYKCPKKI